MGRQQTSPHLIPAPRHASNLSPPRPRGAANRRCAIGRDKDGACGWSHDPLPGGCGAPPWGHYDPCARSSLDGKAARTVFREQDGDEAVSGRRGISPSHPTPAAEAPPGGRDTGGEAFHISAARGFKIAGSGAPRGVRRVAQSLRAASWLKEAALHNLRLAALRRPSSSTPAATRAGHHPWARARRRASRPSRDGSGA